MKTIALALLFYGGLTHAQVRVTPQPEITTNLPAQKIGPRDLIVVQVYDSPELSRSIRVGDDGAIRIPMLKQKVNAQGLMPGELELAIDKALEEEGLIVDPSVTVTVAEYSSRPISVAGAVRSPLTFQASGPVTLLEALTRAGGLTPEAGSEILISRSQPDPESEETSLIRRVPVKALIESAEPDANLRLSGGEEIRVPEAGRIFVVGNVRKPGVFSVKEGAETSVLKVLALAEGLAPFAGKQAFIYRREGAGAKNEITIELAAIMARKSPDVRLFPSDVLYIPDNHNRRFGLAVLEKLLLFGSTAGATALIYNGVR